MFPVFAPSHVPKLSRGWIPRLAAGLRTGTLKDTGANELAIEANIVLPQLIASFVEPDGQFLFDAYEGNAPREELFAAGSRFGLLAYLAAFASTTAEAPRHLCVLAPQGAGKTSLLAMLALAKLTNGHLRHSEYRYLALGPKSLESIASFPSQSNTVLLLDGFDEDTLSYGRSAERLGELALATQAYRKVIIAADSTSVSLGLPPRGGKYFVATSGHALAAVAMAPFDQAETEKYLSHRFGSKDPRCEQLIAKFAELGPVLSRPLFLRFADDLVGLEPEHWHEYGILASIVDARLSAASARLHNEGHGGLDLVHICVAFALAEYGSQSNPQSAGASPRIVTDSVRDALVTSGLLQVFGPHVHFSHPALRSFFVAKSVTDGLGGSEPIRPSYDVMAHIRSWLRWPPRGADRHSLRWSRLDLSRADLAEWSLTDANMEGANFVEANLTRADLNRTELQHARFCRARLTGANLDETNCEAADFSDADLSETSFSGATLRGSILRGACLRGAYLSRVSLEGADLRGTDLTDVTMAHIQYDVSTRWPSGFNPTQALVALP